MKHARPDYNRIQDPADIIPEDQPVFLLRGQDALAPSLVKDWAIRLLAAGGDIKMAVMALEQSEAMREWQRTQAKKMPDLP